MDDREKWESRHACQDDGQEPSPFLGEILDRGAWPIAAGRALDIATGKGRNALFLAERGFEVVAIDISGVALEAARKRAQARSLRISWRQEDLEGLALPDDQYDLILNFNYLQRSLIPQIKTALKMGGHVIFDTYLVDQQTIGHPKNPAYLLGHNELLRSFREFRVLYYREGKIVERGSVAFRAGLLAQKLA
jgi:tellurite methyltransferase